VLLALEVNCGETDDAVGDLLGGGRTADWGLGEVGEGGLAGGGGEFSERC